MTAAEIQREIARCDREIAAMQNQPPVQPAYLTTLGIEDWRAERRILERMRSDDGIALTAKFRNLTEEEARFVMQTLDGLVSALRIGHINIEIGTRHP